MTPLRPKLIFFFQNFKILKFSMAKKLMSKSQAKIKLSFPQYPFLNYF